MKDEDVINLPYGGSHGQFIADRILNIRTA